MTASALALVAVALAGKPAALKGCEVHGPGFGLERFIRCKEFAVEVFLSVPKAKETGVLDTISRAMISGGDPREVMNLSDLAIGGKKQRAFRYTRKGRKGGMEMGLMTMVPAGKSRARLVRCSHAMDLGCVDVFTLVGKGLPEVTESSAGAKPMFAGNALALGPGCTLKAGGQLTCAGTELNWLALYPGAPDTLDGALPFFREAYGHLGDITTRDRFCQVEKQDVLCRELTVSEAGGAKTRVLYGFTSLRDVRLYVACTSKSGLDTAIPAPCAQVLTLKPEVAPEAQ